MVYSDVTVVLDEQGLLIIATNLQSSRTMALTREAADHLWRMIANELEAESAVLATEPPTANSDDLGPPAAATVGGSVACANCGRTYEDHAYVDDHHYLSETFISAILAEAYEKASALRHYSAMAEQAASQTQQQNESAP